MEARGKRRKASAKGAILATCPLCKGAGKVSKELPFRANPKAWVTSAKRLGMVTCPRCNGSGRIGIE